jgi:hypothetical protein
MALEPIAFNKSTLQSLDFIVNRFLMKLFTTSSLEIIVEYHKIFMPMFTLPSVKLADCICNLQTKIEFITTLF